jgi:predicted transcriptional regulator
MGLPINDFKVDSKKKMRFIRTLVKDVEALELMISKDILEADCQRIGAEQELCIVNDRWTPDENNLDLLKEIDDSHFTTELAKYNIELNCDPFVLGPGTFTNMKRQLLEKYRKAQHAAEGLRSRIIMTGILPTISRKEVDISYLTPLPRYHYLNKQLRSKRGRYFDLFMKGVDELHVRHDNIMFEACNTSFQIHLQLDPKSMVADYNWAMAISAPVLAASANSPLLFGKELWNEIRIALFQQSIETRKSVEEIRDLRPRVTFGKSWVRNCITEIYKEDIARFDVLLTQEDPEDAMETLRNGEIPAMKALMLHNGTVYRWNRPCYGITNGKPHLRIENRYIPSGPSVEDEVANMAFWIGLMKARPPEANAIWEHFQFRDVKSNFFKAARSGIETVFIWKDKEISAKDLINNELLPLAYEGLRKSGVTDDEAYACLGIIEKRMKTHTGAQWQIRNFRKLRDKLSVTDSCIALTAATYENQIRNKPVCDWQDIDLNKANKYLVNHFSKVKQLMSTDLITVFPDDSLLYIDKIMQWYTINHMLIESKKGDLVGIITSGRMSELKQNHIDFATTPVKDYMKRTIQTISMDTEIDEALQIMKSLHITSLPVVRDGKLHGIVTKNDMLRWLEFKES